MTNDTDAQQADHGGGAEPQHGSTVEITIDTGTYRVHRGRQTVAYLKQLAGISPSYELSELRDGRLVPLPDDGAVTITGGEVFKSNVRVGHSS